jgi:hypothetical protein
MSRLIKEERTEQSVFWAKIKVGKASGVKELSQWTSHSRFLGRSIYRFKRF